MPLRSTWAPSLVASCMSAALRFLSEGMRYNPSLIFSGCIASPESILVYTVFSDGSCSSVSVRLHWGSTSTSSTFFPSRTRPAPKLRAVVVFATPPL